MGALTKRMRQVAESLLEDEGLTNDLDDVAARVLLEWGIACARRMICSTIGLTDLEAEKIMEDRLRAIRRLMRLVSQWIAHYQDQESEAQTARESLVRILRQAYVVYGEDMVWPDETRQSVFLRHHVDVAANPGQMIEDLRRLIEDP